MTTNELEGKRTGVNSPLLPRMTHTFALNSSFYAAVPHPYKDYYWRFVRRYLNWYDGYVPEFHRSDFGVFSSRLAYTVLHKLAQQTTSNKVLFDDEGVELKVLRDYRGDSVNALEFSEKWSECVDLHNKITQAVEWSFAAGDALITLGQNNGEVVPLVHRKDSYFLDTNVFGEITKLTVAIHTYQDQASKVNDHDRNFYLMMERRYNKNSGKPEERLTIKEGTASRVTHSDINFHGGDVEFRSLPSKVRDKLKQAYPTVEFGKWEELAFKTLGAYLIKATPSVSFMPSLPFGESLLSNAIHLLMSYDFIYSAKLTDLYLGRGRVLIPRHMGNDNGRDTDHYTGFDQSIMQKVPYVNPDDQSPTSIQFDLRADDWKMSEDEILRKFSTSLGISERSIAAYLTPASEKPTAYEISSDENATANFIESKRPLIIRELNKMMREVLDWYGYKGEIVIPKFSRIGLSNFNNVVNQVSILKQNGLIDEKTALEKIYPDFTQKQILAIQTALENERKQKEQVEAEKKEIKTDVVEAHEDTIRTGNPSKPNT